MKRIVRDLAARLVGACIALSAMASSGALAAEELVFGVYPYLSPRQIADQFTPLREYLSRELGREVALRSAPNFMSFVERTRDGEYDFIFTAPHMARLSQTRDGFQPLAQTGYRIVIVAVTRKDSPVQTLADLRGRSVSIGARLSMTHQIINAELRGLGLVLEKDVRFSDASSFSNVLQAVIRDEADVGATGTLLWDDAPADEKRQLREIFRQKNPVPGFILAAHPRLDKPLARKLQAALHGFKDVPQGREYFRKTHQVDFRPVDEATMRSLDPYTGALVQQ